VKRRNLRVINLLRISSLWLLLSFLPFFISLPLVSKDSPENDRLNVLLITIDTLRTDRLSCYGESQLATPHIDRFAARAMLFTRAFAHTTTTLPSHVNILLGTTPLSHGVHDNFNFVVPDGSLTLAKHLKKFGYATGAVIGAYPLDSRFGLDQGFDSYDDNYDKESTQKFATGERRAKDVIDKTIAWINNQRSAWFLWAHIYDPHDPYDPPEPFRTQLKDRLYDGEVAYSDHELGRLFNHLEERGLLKETIVVLTGDHGESLGEHGEKTHGYLAYNSTLWIPLIVYVPGFSSGRCLQNVSHIDIFPTVCDALEVEKPVSLQGVSLLPALQGKSLPKKPIYFESLYPFYNRGWAPLTGYISDQDKFIDCPIPELYNLKDDFRELRNLINQKEAARYREKLIQLVSEIPLPQTSQERRRVDREAMERLKSLGYISSPAGTPKKNYGPEDDIKTLLPFFNRTMEAMEVSKKGNIRQGMDMLKEVITAEKNVDLAYSYLAQMYKELGQLNEGIEVLRLGLGRFPESYEIFFTYLSLLQVAGRSKELIQAIDEARLPQMDVDSELWVIKGNAFLMTGDLDRALDSYKRAGSIDPEYAAVSDGLGKTCFSLFMKTDNLAFLQEAITHFKKAIELDPDFARAYGGLGAAYRRSGDLDGAVRTLEKGLEIAPDNFETLYELGGAYLEAGENVKALRCFERFRKQFGSSLSPEESKDLDELIKKIKERK